LSVDFPSVRTDLVQASSPVLDLNQVCHLSSLDD
jgi:hypothetical protein